MSNHYDEKCNKCGMCDEVFSDGRSLNSHMLIQFDEKNMGRNIDVEDFIQHSLLEKNMKIKCQII